MAGRFNPDNYVGVNERLEKFRADHPNWGLQAQVIKDDGKYIAIKATVTNEEDRVVATGHAEETRGEGPVNKTNPMENCETSAWGRALAALGYEVTRGIASREEMEKANRSTQPSSEPNEQRVDLAEAVAQLDTEEKKTLKARWDNKGWDFSYRYVPPELKEEALTLIDSCAGTGGPF